ncbi:MAG: cyclic pyranopterin monophosphate synthase MoaC [Dehalococcoidia bacterium]|nr:cyclic pyranopterin monophosphate synthase MoaC [Dehalococcoidia bacterium]|tara:strand:+ start:6889 stop:7389 length:501 start_codon:yes stop_codon:yes gene_type:complete
MTNHGKENDLSLTHINEQGAVNMVDVGNKPITDREAVAVGHVVVRPKTLELIQQGLMKKGDVVTIAQLAGIMGAKQTANLIPLCHPLPLNKVDVQIDIDPAANRLVVTSTASTSSKTGVEMEALMAVSVACLTLYDMCKAVDHNIQIDQVRLLRKTGGQSGDIFLE